MRLLIIAVEVFLACRIVNLCIIVALVYFVRKLVKSVRRSVHAK